MPEPSPLAPTVFDLTVHERVLLFCVATRTDWQKAGVPGETALNMIEKGLIVDHPFDRLALTMCGRAALKAMLPAL
jgi:hypothetical protein